jgi:hypothetical protein
MKTKSKIILGIAVCAVLFLTSMLILPYPANIPMMLGCFLVLMAGVISLKRHIKGEDKK